MTLREFLTQNATNEIEYSINMSRKEALRVGINPGQNWLHTFNSKLLDEEIILKGNVAEFKNKLMNNDPSLVLKNNVFTLLENNF